jgi:hypothetical protein
VSSGAKFTKAVADPRDTPGLEAKGFALALLLGAATYSSAAHLLLNIELIPFSPAPVYAAQGLIVRGTVAFTRKIAAGNRRKMKQLTVVRIDGSWKYRTNGSTHTLDMVNVESRRILDFEIIQRTKALGRGNYQRSSSGMEVEAMRRMVKR